MSKQTEGKVPEIRFRGSMGHWHEDLLGEQVEFFSGLTYAPSDVQSGFGALVLRSSNVKRGEIVDADNVYVNTDAVNSKNVEIGDIVVVVRNGSRSLIGKHAQVKSEMPNTVIGAFMTGVHSQRPAFTNALLDTNQFDSEIAKNLGATINQITTGAFREMAFHFPETASEQKLIGAYFKSLDRMIGLHQRKHDKLVTLKQAMLQKMFPQDGATTPEIRFKGFEGEWRVRTFGDSTLPISSNTLSRADLNYKSGPAKNVHYGDILVRFEEVLDANNPELPFVTSHENVQKFRSSRLQDGDIVLADAAEDETVGKCTEIANTGDTIVLAGLHTIAVRPSMTFAPFYLGYFLNSHAYHNQLLPLMQGTKVLSVSRTTLLDTRVLFPSAEDEQAKIGTYFYNLDKLISKHATQLEKLKNIKSACLEKMFV